MQARLCPGQPFGVAVGFLIIGTWQEPRKLPGPRPLVQKKLRREDKDCCCLARPMAIREGTRRPLRFSTPPPAPPRPARWDHLSPGWSPARLWPPLPKRRACRLVALSWSWVPIYPKPGVRGLRKTPKESGGQDCVGVVTGAPFLAGAAPPGLGYLLCAVCSD